MNIYGYFLHTRIHTQARTDFTHISQLILREPQFQDTGEKNINTQTLPSTAASRTLCNNLKPINLGVQSCAREMFHLTREKFFAAVQTHKHKIDLEHHLFAWSCAPILE